MVLIYDNHPLRMIGCDQGDTSGDKMSVEEFGRVHRACAMASAKMWTDAPRDVLIDIVLD